MLNHTKQIISENRTNPNTTVILQLLKKPDAVFSTTNIIHIKKLSNLKVKKDYIHVDTKQSMLALK